MWGDRRGALRAPAGDREIAPTGNAGDREIAPTGNAGDQEIAPTGNAGDREIAPTGNAGDREIAPYNCKSQRRSPRAIVYVIKPIERSSAAARLPAPVRIWVSSQPSALPSTPESTSTNSTALAMRVVWGLANS